VQVRLYDVLFKSESPDALGDEWLGDLNPDSLQIIKGARIPPHLAQTAKVRTKSMKNTDSVCLVCVCVVCVCARVVWVWVCGVDECACVPEGARIPSHLAQTAKVRHVSPSSAS
jgi:hypothetical protein